jgi:hypothetical protein
VQTVRNARTVATALFLVSGLAVAQSEETGAALQAREWLAAKFLGKAETPLDLPHFLIHTKSGRIDRNRRQGRIFRIADAQYERGVAMPQPGEIVVHLPGPAAKFEAIVGVDSNDLGYYSNAGRGNVVLSVVSGGVERFRSGVLHEGMAGVPASVDLGDSAEFTLKLAAVGDRPRTYQAEWDQADWADARVTLSDGKALWLADLPAGPLPVSYTMDAPFSFRYGGRPSAEFLSTWKTQRSSRAILRCADKRRQGPDPDIRRQTD